MSDNTHFVNNWNSLRLTKEDFKGYKANNNIKIPGKVLNQMNLGMMNFSKHFLYALEALVLDSITGRINNPSLSLDQRKNVVTLVSQKIKMSFIKKCHWKWIKGYLRYKFLLLRTKLILIKQVMSKIDMLKIKDILRIVLITQAYIFLVPFCK